MPGQRSQDKAYLGWWASVGLGAWARAEAERRGVALSDILTEALSEYRRKHEAGEPSPAHSERTQP
jgi:hypothetical protein